MKKLFSKCSLTLLLAGILTAMLLTALSCQNNAPEASRTNQAPSTTTRSPATTVDQSVTTTEAPSTTYDPSATTTLSPIITTAPTTTEPPVTTKPIGSEKIEQAMAKAAERYRSVGVQVAVITDGRVSATYEYGWAEKDVRAMEADTKIRVASLTKTLVGMITFRLAEEGKLDLDADISDYIGVEVRNPAYPDDPITLRMLLSHTSGLENASYADSLEKLQKKLQSASTFTENRPGDLFAYNNFGFGVIGSICELATGKTLNTLAKEYFFTPMGIDATLAPAELDESEKAVIYKADGSIGLSLTKQLEYGIATEPVQHMKHYAGGLFISASDYAKLLTLLIADGVYDGERYLSAESVAEMERVQLTKSNGTMQCLPVWKYDRLYGEDSLFYHTGNNYGVYALYTYDPLSRFGTVVITTGSTLKYDSYSLYADCGNITQKIYEAVPHESEVAPILSAGIAYAVSAQSVYGEADTSAAVLGELAKGQAVVVTEIADGWVKVRYGGGVGYLPESGVTAERPEDAIDASDACGGTVYLGDDRVVAIDAGHQGKGMTEKEPNGPGSDEMKAMLTSGTTGVSTRLPEYQLTLDVSLKLRDELIARGYTVVMIRESNNVTLSNAQRAQIANAAESGAFVRIHANGSNNASVQGALTMCQTANNPYNGALYDESHRLSQAIINAYVAQTGLKKRNIIETDTMTGINWASVPSTIIEMGFMSNAEEDEKMATEAFQLNAAVGIADGLDAYFAG